jgi:hypothetical protein
MKNKISQDKTPIQASSAVQQKPDGTYAFAPSACRSSIKAHQFPQFLWSGRFVASMSDPTLGHPHHVVEIFLVLHPAPADRLRPRFEVDDM